VFSLFYLPPVAAIRNCIFHTDYFHDVHVIVTKLNFFVKSINQLVFIIGMHCVYCEMGSKVLNTRGADKSLARNTSRCRRTESIVSLERMVYSCAELQVFSCYGG